MHFHHIGIVTVSIADSKKFYCDVLDFKIESNLITDFGIDVKVQFLRDQNDTLFELVEPLSHKSPVANFAKGSKNKLHHLAYKVKDFDKRFIEFRNQGMIPTTKPLPSVAFDGRRVVFFLTQPHFLLELIEDT